MTDIRWWAEAALVAFIVVSILLLELGRWLDNRSARFGLAPKFGPGPRRTLPRSAPALARPRRDADRAISHVTAFRLYDQDAE